ncbi:MAG: hypothetical protein V7694_26365, partial [Rhodococcus sp. (in: high G+C Gram-positive bacteria)]
AVPVAFGAVLVIAAFASKLGDSSVYFCLPLVFTATGTMIWLRARRMSDRLHAAVGAGLLSGCGVLVAICGLAGGLLLNSATFWAAIAVVAAIAAPISNGISPFASPKN